MSGSAGFVGRWVDGKFQRTGFSALHPANDLYPSEQNGRDQVERPESFDPTEGEVQDMIAYSRFGGEMWVKRAGHRPVYIPPRELLDIETKDQ